MITKDNSLDLIKKSGILTQNDLDSIVEMSPELKDTFLKVQMFRTPTEMRISVLNDIKHPTPDSKYWQSVREQNVMYTELVSLSYEYRKTMVEIKKLQRDLGKETDELEKELKVIELEKTQWLLMNMEKTAKARIDELNEWSYIKRELEKEMNYSTENVNEHQLLSYCARFINQSAVMGDDGTPVERQNLLGQLQTTLKEVERKGLIEKLLDIYGEGKEDVKKYLKEINNGY